jgi:hypothetical protein
MSKYQTLVILAPGLKAHPREVVIDGVIYEVVTSAEGHLAAQCDVLQEAVDATSHGNIDAEELQNQAILAVHAAREAKVGGYRD